MSQTRIADRFTVISTLEEGKLGTLYQVDDNGTPALLLVLDAAATQDDATLEAIIADNRALASSHDALLTNAWGIAGDQRWLRTEATGGRLLSEHLAARARVGHDEVLRLGRSLGKALEEAEAHGARHLDLGPHRVLVEGDGLSGAPRVFGFGWWRLLPAWAGNGDDAFYGEPEFMPAELCRAEAAASTSDVYSAALVLWATAAGKPPFRSSQPLMTLKRQAIEKPLRLDLVKPTLKGVKEIAAALAPALDKAPEARPVAAAFLGAISELAEKYAPALLSEEPSAPAGRAEAFSGTLDLPSAAQVGAGNTMQLGSATVAALRAAIAEARDGEGAGADTTLKLSAAEVAAALGDREQAAGDRATVKTQAADDEATAEKAAAEKAAAEKKAADDQAAAEKAAAEKKAADDEAAAEKAAADKAAADAKAAAEKAAAEKKAADDKAAAAQASSDDDDSDDDGDSDDSDDSDDRRGRRGKRGRRRGKRGRDKNDTAESKADEKKADDSKAVVAAADAKKADDSKAVVAPDAKKADEKKADENKADVGADAKKADENKADAKKADEKKDAGGGARPATGKLRVVAAESAFFTADSGTQPAVSDPALETPALPEQKAGRGVLLAILVLGLLMVASIAWMYLNAQKAPVRAEQKPVEPAVAEPAAAPAPAAAVAAPDDGLQRVNALVEEGNKALSSGDAATALAKAKEALALRAGHPPAAMLERMAEADLQKAAAAQAPDAGAVAAAADAGEPAEAVADAAAGAAAAAAAEAAAAEKAAADKAAAEAAAAEAAAAEKAAAEKAAAEAAAADKAAADKAAADKAAADKAAADKAAADKAAADKAAADKAAADKAAAAKAAADKAASDKAAAANKAAAAKAAADKAAADKAAAAAKAAASAKAAADKAAAEKAAAAKAAAAKAAADKAAADKAAAAKKPSGTQKVSAKEEQASKMASLAQKASNPKLKVLYLEKAVKLDPSNAKYQNLLKIAKAELAAEQQ